VEQRKRGNVIKYGRGLNSFSVSKRYVRLPNSRIHAPMEHAHFAANDPNRYRVQGMTAGDFVVVDRNTNQAVATQLDTRDEAHRWIAEKVKA
jgi:hypothetical protein